MAIYGDGKHNENMEFRYEDEQKASDDYDDKMIAELMTAIEDEVQGLTADQITAENISDVVKEWKSNLPQRTETKDL